MSTASPAADRPIVSPTRTLRVELIVVAEADISDFNVGLEAYKIVVDHQREAGNDAHWQAGAVRVEPFNPHGRSK